MISFSRGNETPRRIAKADCEIPRGFRNSSRSISPGCVGGRVVGRRRRTSRCFRPRGLVVVRDFNFVGIAVLPGEAYSILIVDSNTVLTSAATNQALESISRWHRKFLQVTHPIELSQLPASDSPENRRAHASRLP